jgi:hypothetical protein
LDGAVDDTIAHGNVLLMIPLDILIPVPAHNCAGCSSRSQLEVARNTNWSVALADNVKSTL